MKRMKYVLSIAILILAAAVVVSAQGQVTAVRAGKMFDPKSGTNLANQVVLIAGDKITERRSGRPRENSGWSKSDRPQPVDRAPRLD